MDEIIEIQDNLNAYALDEVDCFQRPIAILLDNINPKYSDVFICYAKIIEFYYGSCSFDKLSSTIAQVVSNKMGITFEQFKGRKLVKFICESIDNEYPVILGIDYCKMFYSRYYLRESYPHWFIINGYDSYTELFSLLDYTQFLDSKFQYEPFTIPYKMIKDLNKGYIKKYKTDYSCFTINADAINTDIKKLVVDMLEFAIENMQSGVYTIVRELDKLSAGLNLQSDDISVENSRINIINLNKSYATLIKLIVNFMYLYNFNSHAIEEIVSLQDKISKLWQNFSLITLSQIDTQVGDKFKTPNAIKEIEEKIVAIIEDFHKYMVSFKATDEISIEKNNSEKDKILNDPDKVISLLNDDVLFNFVKMKDYNWWEYDNAPKYEIVKTKSKKNITLSAKLDIADGFSVENFQAGFYIKTAQDIYFAGIDNGSLYLLDKVNVDNFSCFKKLKKSYDLYVEIGNNFIEFGEYIGQIRKVLLKRLFERQDDLTLGVACKTWGKFGKLKIKFTDIEYE
ncbi:MAG: hypothetical protein UIM53_05460 [Acutalibacteraceae bacterium]|nr:hypothetical protein [Acutalibacteraceae bacterium]